MKVLLSVLREWADIPDDPGRVREALDGLGLAVEGVETLGVAVEGVVTARILRTERHPDAAKVTRCWVDAGDGQERHVWCGATNMGPGDVVPLATIGTRMPDGREIARRGILGIDSEGMLCSAPELGLDGDAGGLLLLPPDTPPGLDVFSALGVEPDVLFDLDLTRNRPDCWGHLGVARDLAAHFSVPVRTTEAVPRSNEGNAPAVEILDDRCGRFTATRVSGVRVTESPEWIRRRLERLGMRPINNVVDASNLVMLELNQPNHAYDAAVVSGFRVRAAAEGESIVTLDGVSRTLSADDLLVCDTDDAPVGIAGVMGDSRSEITAGTTEVLLECAWFHPDAVRLTAQRHGLRTEASVRFERGADPEMWRSAVDRFARLLRDTCPELIVHGPGTVRDSAGLPRSATVTLSARRIEQVLGVAVPADTVASLLSAIGFALEGDEREWSVIVPTWRPDCTLDVDLIEEIARHVGYERIGRRVPTSPTHGRLSPLQKRRRELRRLLIGLGLDEAMPSPFLSPGRLGAAGLDESRSLRIANPLTVEESVLRTSLRPGLLEAVRHNLSHRAPRVRFFEIGHVYPAGSQALPDETEHLAIVVAGADAATAVHQWGMISDALGVKALLDQSRVPEGLHPARSASLTRGPRIIGAVGEVDPAILDAWDIPVRVSCLEIDLGVVLPEIPRPVQAAPVRRSPTSDVDLALVVPEAVPAGDIVRAIRQAAGALLVHVSLFDVYRGPGVADGHRSLAFRLRLQDPHGTIPEGAGAEMLEKCIQATAPLGASRRA